MHFSIPDTEEGVGWRPGIHGNKKLKYLHILQIFYKYYTFC